MFIMGFAIDKRQRKLQFSPVNTAIPLHAAKEVARAINSI
ncbi:hypothetical protein NT01EI_0432 [Edwardsiella ictaluri 93-146]|uniref:Uncharacterized protein n=1 Tax=Edwardsiella ictaluri (strain 93-146) TaxID=634503 RepID=C5BF84_EDWI9|nr:hypothetical protein NT01EI_0432 [Edwardsiella ictaluri 93-146]